MGVMLYGDARHDLGNRYKPVLLKYTTSRIHYTQSLWCYLADNYPNQQLPRSILGRITDMVSRTCPSHPPRRDHDSFGFSFSFI